MSTQVYNHQICYWRNRLKTNQSSFFLFINKEVIIMSHILSIKVWHRASLANCVWVTAILIFLDFLLILLPLLVRSRLFLVTPFYFSGLSSQTRSENTYICKNYTNRLINILTLSKPFMTIFQQMRVLAFSANNYPRNTNTYFITLWEYKALTVLPKRYVRFRDMM